MFSPSAPNEETAAQEQALAIMSLIESIESLTKNYEVFTEALPREFKEEGKMYLGQLRAIFSVLDDADTDVSKFVNNTLRLNDLAPSKIKRLGIAKEIIALREEKGMPLEDIAARFGLSPSTVSNFIKAYKKAAPTQKNQLNKSNVYDIEHNMQVLHSALLRQMARFETDGEISAKFLSEYRQLLALADRQIKEFNNAKKFEMLTRIIEEVLIKYCLPEAKQQVIKELQTLGVKGFMPVEGTPRRIESA